MEVDRAIIEVDRAEVDEGTEEVVGWQLRNREKQ